MTEMTAASPVADWRQFRVVRFDGQRDTKKYKKTAYKTASLLDIFSFPPAFVDKSQSPSFIPSQYHDWDAREHGVQRELGSFVALVGDVDKGNHEFEKITGLAKAIAKGCAWMVHSSSHSRPGDMRWRIIIPLSTPAKFDDWYDAQLAFYKMMERSGVSMDHAMARPGQPVYLPNIPEIHAKSETRLRDENGNPLFYKAENSGPDLPGIDIFSGRMAAAIKAIRKQQEDEEAENKRLREQAAQRKINRPSSSEEVHIMTDFNDANSVENLLSKYGYKQSPKSTKDWRSPHQEGETYATRAEDGRWISLSQSDVSNGIGHNFESGCFGDAYDLYAHYEHGGDHRSAFRELYRERNIARGNVIEGPWPEVAPLNEEDFGWEPVHDWEVDASTPLAIPEVFVSKDGMETPLPLEWFDDIDAQLEANWLVDDLIPSQGLCLVYGHPGSGKSFFALDMAMHVALGDPWREKSVEQGLVIYIGAEGQRGLRQRVAAFRQHHRIDEMPFALIPVEVNLLANDGDLGKVIETIRIASGRFGMPVRMVVVDTLSRTFGGGDEVGSDMVSYVNNVGRIQAAYECTTMVIHHRPKDSANETPRGHGSLWGACDTVILVNDFGTYKEAKVTKQKDAEAGDPIHFTLSVVELGKDEKGRAVTSCVVIPAETAPAKQQGDGPRLNDGQAITLSALKSVMHEIGRYDGHNIPDAVLPPTKNTLVTTVDAWTERALSVLGNDEKNPDSVKKSFNRHRDKLVRLNVIGIYHGHVWVK